MDRWKLASAAGWGVAALMTVTALRCVRELRERQEADVAPHAERRREAQHVSAAAPGRLEAVVIGGDTRQVGEGLALAGERLVLMGHEDQASYLFAASGQLLERADLPG